MALGLGLFKISQYLCTTFVLLIQMHSPYFFYRGLAKFYNGYHPIGKFPHFIRYDSI